MNAIHETSINPIDAIKVNTKLCKAVEVTIITYTKPINNNRFKVSGNTKKDQIPFENTNGKT